MHNFIHSLIGPFFELSNNNLFLNAPNCDFLFPSGARDYT
jgi:hypothetical protein